MEPKIVSQSSFDQLEIKTKDESKRAMKIFLSTEDIFYKKCNETLMTENKLKHASRKKS